MHIREEPEADEGLGLEDQPERQLDGVPLEVQEAWICEDLMFVLQVRSLHCKGCDAAMLIRPGSRGHLDTL